MNDKMTEPISDGSSKGISPLTMLNEIQTSEIPLEQRVCSKDSKEGDNDANSINTGEHTPKKSVGKRMMYGRQYFAPSRLSKEIKRPETFMIPA